MKSKRLNEDPAMYALILDTDDEVMASLAAFARDTRLSAASFTAIGALHDVILGYYSREKGDYKKIPVREQVEVLTMAGDITLLDEDVSVHAHIVLGRSDGSACGGHLLQAHVWPTLEVVVTETPAHLRRRHDARTGLALIDL